MGPPGTQRPQDRASLCCLEAEKGEPEAPLFSGKADRLWKMLKAPFVGVPGGEPEPSDTGKEGAPRRSPGGRPGGCGKEASAFLSFPPPGTRGWFVVCACLTLEASSPPLSLRQSRVACPGRHSGVL